jgi:hypothetical protein
MNDELERIWKEQIEASLWYQPDICLKGVRKPQDTWLRIAGVSAKIRTEHLPNINAEPYRYVNPISEFYIIL